MANSTSATRRSVREKQGERVFIWNSVQRNLHAASRQSCGIKSIAKGQALRIGLTELCLGDTGCSRPRAVQLFCLRGLAGGGASM